MVKVIIDRTIIILNKYFCQCFPNKWSPRCHDQHGLVHGVALPRAEVRVVPSLDRIYTTVPLSSCCAGHPFPGENRSWRYIPYSAHGRCARTPSVRRPSATALRFHHSCRRISGTSLIRSRPWPSGSWTVRLVLYISDRARKKKKIVKKTVLKTNHRSLTSNYAI